jgi:hypothetical protein
MPDFNLPAGCTMRITASMETAAIDRHRWSVAILSAGSGGDGDPRARYGARIIGGQVQKIDTPAIDHDCICRVLSSSETGGDWLDDVAKVSTDEPDEVTMTFARPQPEDAPDPGGECVLTFRLNPAVVHA